MEGGRIHSLLWWKGLSLLLDTRPDGLHTDSVGTYRVENRFDLLFEFLPRPGWMLALRRMRTSSLCYSSIFRCRLDRVGPVENRPFTDKLHQVTLDI